MYEPYFSTRFQRDVKTCTKRHWNIVALKNAMADVLSSDDAPLNPRYKQHSLVGSFQGYYSVHVDSAPNPPKDQWVLMYKILGNKLEFVRTGTHQEVYGK